MDIFQIVAIGIVGGILAVMLKKDNPTFAVMVSLAVTILIFIMLMSPLAGLIALITNLTGHFASGQQYILIVVQIIGIAYVAEFGSQICEDAGEKSIASKVELAGKVLIMGIAAPLIISLVEQVIAIIP